jgi:hypothetical protein
LAAWRRHALAAAVRVKSMSGMSRTLASILAQAPARRASGRPAARMKFVVARAGPDAPCRAIPAVGKNLDARQRSMRHESRWIPASAGTTEDRAANIGVRYDVMYY